MDFRSKYDRKREDSMSDDVEADGVLPSEHYLFHIAAVNLRPAARVAYIPGRSQLEHGQPQICG